MSISAASRKRRKDMMKDNAPPTRDRKGSPSRLSTAQQLLVLLSHDTNSSLTDLAKLARVNEKRLAQCRDGVRPLDADMQMRLAAAVVESAPRHRRLAQRLYAQAQTSLRMTLEDGRVHPYYPKSDFR